MQGAVVVVDTALVVAETVPVTVLVLVLVKLTVEEVEADAVVVEVEADMADEVVGELCSLELVLETLDATKDVVVTVEVVLAADEDATLAAPLEVIGGVADGKLALATSPSRTATMTAAPALAPTFPY